MVLRTISAQSCTQASISPSLLSDCTRKQRVLTPNRYFAKHPLGGTQSIEEPLREIEEIVCTDDFKARSLKERAGPLRGKKFGIDVHRTSLNYRSGDRIPWIVLDDAT